MKTLLIVEDEKMIRQGIKNMIQRSGVPIEIIIECNNGETAWEILQEQQIDVMFTDIRMPKMDGIALVQKMQELELKPLTVVISGYDDFSYAVEMLRMGVKEYILKPVDREQIVAIMQKLEEEIQKRNEEVNAKHQMSLQQLRYLCMATQMEEKEKELLQNQYRSQFFEEDYVVCCCNCDMEGEESGSASIYLGTVEAHQIFIVENKNIGFLLKNELSRYYVGMSKPMKGIEHLQEAYMQAKAMRKMAFAMAEKEVVFEASFALDKEVTLDEVQQKQIDAAVHMLGTERIKEVVTLLSDMTKQVENKTISIELFEKQIQYFIRQAAKNYEQVLKVQEDDILELQNMYQYQTIQEYIETLKEWVIKFNELIGEEFDDYKNKQKVQQAISYIYENFQNDLNMAVVSNHISMNYSLFSYVFKQYTGKNFVTYLKELRIQEAKRLLEKTDMRVIEISQAVGYENEKHFMKTFKAICGVSPTEYRKNILLKG